MSDNKIEAPVSNDHHQIGPNAHPPKARSGQARAGDRTDGTRPDAAHPKTTMVNSAVGVLRMGEPIAVEQPAQTQEAK